MRIAPWSVILTDAGHNHLAVTAAVRPRSDLRQRDVKALLANLLQVILDDMDAEKADRATRTLQDADAGGQNRKA